MLPPGSTSSAQATERPVLAPDWLVLAMTALVCLALWLIYPRQDLEKRLAGLAEREEALRLAPPRGEHWQEVSSRHSEE